MALVRWDPFRELEHMQSRLNRFFGDAPSQRAGEDMMSFSGWSPAVDVQETDKEYADQGGSAGREERGRQGGAPGWRADD